MRERLTRKVGRSLVNARFGNDYVFRASLCSKSLGSRSEPLTCLVSSDQRFMTVGFSRCAWTTKSERFKKALH
jgi:hypothetical protein